MLEPRPPQGHGRRLHMAPAGGQPVLPAGADQALYRRSIAPNCWSKACGAELVNLQSFEAPQSSIHGRWYPQDQNAALVTRALTTEHKLEKKRQRQGKEAVAGLRRPSPEDRALLGNGERQGERGFPLGRARGPAATEKKWESELSLWLLRNSVLS